MNCKQKKSYNVLASEHPASRNFLKFSCIEVMIREERTNIRQWGNNFKWICCCCNFFSTIYRRCHEKTSYVSNYASLLYCMNGSVEGRHIDWKNFSMCKSDFIARSAIIGVFLIDASALYRPIYAIKWKAHNLIHRRFFCDNDDILIGSYSHMMFYVARMLLLRVHCRKTLTIVSGTYIYFFCTIIYVSCKQFIQCLLSSKISYQLFLFPAYFPTLYNPCMNSVANNKSSITPLSFSFTFGTSCVCSPGAVSLEDIAPPLLQFCKIFSNFPWISPKLSTFLQNS